MKMLRIMRLWLSGPLTVALVPLCCRASPPSIPISAEPLAAACTASSAAGLRGAGSGPPLLLAQSGTSLFQASFDASGGHFDAYTLAFTGGQAGAGPSLWDAGDILSGGAGRPARPSPESRRIYTLKTDGGNVTMPFLWPDLTDAQRALLNMAPFVAKKKNDGLGAQRVAFLRGDRSLEGAPFRRRASVLGDSVHSAPVYVGVASAAVQGSGYAAFYARTKLRRAAVYLGANDGMLHAFDVVDGSELFAYVPDALIATLNELTSPAYVHQAYVDGLAGAAEAQVNGAWKSVLVSGMGGGAQGVFALDVSDPQQFAAGSGALWEFTDGDDPDMGNVLSLPQIAQFRAGASGTRYFAVVASGLNNYADDGHRTAAGNGALFLLALDKAPAAPWQLNVNYYRLVTPIADSALANGLSAPALVTDADGAVRYAYAGDLQGNLWRFDFSGSTPSNAVVGPGAGKTPLFVARDAGGTRQPISSQPKVVYAAGGGYLILFGTGQMLSGADRSPSGFSSQSFYAIIDRLSVPAVKITRSQLAKRTLIATDASNFTISGSPLTAGDMGWYVDFPDASHSGERSVSSAVVSGGQLFFNTLVPGPDACAASLSRSYRMDALTGTSPPAVTTGVLESDYVNGAPTLLTLSASGGAPDAGGHVAQTKNVAVVDIGATGKAHVLATSSATLLLPTGRLSWREIANWNELHAAAIK